MPIDALEIQGVRGIRHPVTIELRGRSLLLHGDNGTGKSSVERALRWALAGEEEPTDEEPYSSESSYRRHVSVASDYPRVHVSFDDGSTIEVTRGNLLVTGHGDEYRVACRRGFPFLRRAELLDVLASRPVDRFQYFESFLGFDHVDTVTKELADLKSALERRCTELRQTTTAELGALRPLLPPGAQPQTDTLAELEQAALEVATGLGIDIEGRSWDEVAEKVVALGALETEDDLEQRRGHLSALKGDIEAFLTNDMTGDLEYPETFEAQRVALQAETLDASHITLIEDALSHFESDEGETCPLCGQKIDWERTKEDLRRRSESLAAYGRILEKRAESAESWLNRWTAFELLQRRLVTLLGAEQAGLEALAKAPDGLDLLVGIQVPRRDLDSTILAIGGEALGSYIEESTAKAISLVTAALSSLPAAEQLPDLRLATSLYSRLGEKRTELWLLQSQYESTKHEADAVARIREALIRTRQDVAQEILERVGETVSEFYFAIHPSEEACETTGPPTIDVQRHGRGTAFVRGAFDGNAVRDPQWVYSDGHLDTVGICIFLALRRYRGDEKDDPRLLILDDVIISIDLGHARRLIGLLKERFDDHQLLLLTHNGLFAHWCASLIPGLRRLQIKSWSLEDGPRIGEYLEARDRLLVSLESGSAKEVGLHLMSLMDEWLAEARYAYSVAVPAKPDEQYTLSEIWAPFAKTVRKVGKLLSSDLGGATERIDALADLPAIRNALPAHENEFAREFPREVIVEVAQSAVALVDALYCSECRCFAKPIPNRFSPSIVHCSCRALQYLPPS